MSDIVIAMIAACDKNLTIGRDGDMPWKLSSDLKRFKQVTMGCPIIMGRKTYQSMGRRLPGRTNIVITQSIDHIDGTIVTDNIDTAIDIAIQTAQESGKETIFIVGGGQIYKQAITRADKLYITHIEAEINGDTHFPTIESNMWQPIHSQGFPAGEKDNYPTRYVIYQRKPD